MKCLPVAFNLALVFVLAIPLLLEGRPLATGDQDDENLPVLTTVTAEETTQVMVDYLDLNGSSSDGEDEAAPGSPPDAALHRPARTPPSPQGRYPPQHRQKPAPWSGGPAIVGGRRPSAPPAPRGRNPPHWVRLSDQPAVQGPWLLDVFHRLLRALSGLRPDK